MLCCHSFVLILPLLHVGASSHRMSSFSNWSCVGWLPRSCKDIMGLYYGAQHSGVHHSSMAPHRWQLPCRLLSMGCSSGPWSPSAGACHGLWAPAWVARGDLPGAPSALLRWPWYLWDCSSLYFFTLLSVSPQQLLPFLEYPVVGTTKCCSVAQLWPAAGPCRSWVELALI